MRSSNTPESSVLTSARSCLFISNAPPARHGGSDTVANSQAQAGIAANALYASDFFHDCLPELALQSRRHFSAHPAPLSRRDAHRGISPLLLPVFSWPAPRSGPYTIVRKAGAVARPRHTLPRDKTIFRSSSRHTHTHFYEDMEQSTCQSTCHL